METTARLSHPLWREAYNKGETLIEELGQRIEELDVLIHSVNDKRPATLPDFGLDGDWWHGEDFAEWGALCSLRSALRRQYHVVNSTVWTLIISEVAAYKREVLDA
jgi:hypothetical protein